ncbi:hypothetical protein SMMN14_04746 [Sphaerulina musiva]
MATPPAPTLFCNSLRRRPSFASAIPTLLRQSRFVVREQLLDTHDVAVPITWEVHPQAGHTRPTRHLRFLLLSPSALLDVKLDTTIERIRHFSFLTTEPIAIIFLLNPPRETSFRSAKHLGQTANELSSDRVDGVLGYVKLQAEMMNRSDLPHIPILPLNHLVGLEPLLSKHAALHTEHQPGRQHDAAATSRQLMQFCTLRQPMQELTANVLSDTFDNLQDIAKTMVTVPTAPHSSSPTAIAAFALNVLSQDCDENGTLRPPSDDATPQGKLRMLKAILGEVETAEMMEFWREEYQVD